MWFERQQSVCCVHGQDSRMNSTFFAIILKRCTKNQWLVWMGNIMLVWLLCGVDLENITAVEMTWETLPEFCPRVLKRWQMMHGKYLSTWGDQCLFLYPRFSNHLFIHSCGLPVFFRSIRVGTHPEGLAALDKVVKHLPAVIFSGWFSKSLENTGLHGARIVSTLDSRLSTVWLSEIDVNLCQQLFFLAGFSNRWRTLDMETQ